MSEKITAQQLGGMLRRACEECVVLGMQMPFVIRIQDARGRWFIIRTTGDWDHDPFDLVDASDEDMDYFMSPTQGVITDQTGRSVEISDTRVH